jgi:hypothetical protein
MIANPAVSIISAPNTSGPMTISTAALCSGTLFVQGNAEFANQVTMDYSPLKVNGIGANGSSTLTLETSNTTRWQIDGTTGALLGGADNSYDIGSPTRRPHNVYVGGTLSTASLGVATQGQVVRAPANSTTAISVEAPNGYAFVSSKSGSHLGGNAYWDGTNWLRYDTSAGACVWIASTSGIVYYTAAAAANPISWQGGVNLDLSGDIQMAGPQSAIWKGGGTPATPDLGLYCGTSANYMRYVNSANMPHMFYNDGAAGNNWIGATTSVEIRQAGIQAVAFATKGRSLPAADQCAFGQVNCTYVNTEGVDIGAGPLYFAHNASYYINKDSSNNLQCVNLNVVSWGNFCFSGNTGINLSWDGTYIKSTHAFMSGGTIRTEGNWYYFGGNAAAWYWDGSWVRATGGSGIGTSGSYVWMANNSGVGMYWDGTWVQIQPRMYAVNEMNAANAVVRSAGSYQLWDTNVRHERPAGTNRLHSYVYDAQWGYFRTWDSYSCGYIDTGGFHNPSALKSKTNIEPLQDGLRLVLDQRVRPLRFAHPGIEPRDGLPGVADKPSMGFGAEEMLDLIPEVVSLDPDTGEPHGINYGALVAVLWDAVRTLNARLEKLEGAAA